MTQAQFAVVNGQLGVVVDNNSEADYGFGASFFDFDDDGWDDITVSQPNDSVLFFRNTGGQFEQLPSFAHAIGETKSVSWIDFDNDGDSDFFLTQLWGPSKLYRNDGDWLFVEITGEAGIPFVLGNMTSGVAWGDYDKDGFLDVYIGNYDFTGDLTNWLLHNNGDGTFEEVADDLGVEDGVNPSFQAVWWDYNNDNWPDLYLANDHDPENRLWMNNGDGTFTDVSVITNTNLSIFAMCTSVADYDKDGDLDMYVTNNPSGNYLLQNQPNNQFMNVASSLGVAVYEVSWGGLWIDYDNDSWEDLMVAQSNPPGHLFKNNEGTFTETTFESDANGFCNVKGDINNDGYYDVFVTNNVGETCFLYQNLGGLNNYIKIDLRGTISNRDAVGTWIEVWNQGQKDVRYTTNGENYLGQYSQYEIFGLGEANIVDSLVLTWPSGITEVYYDLAANETHSFIEGASSIVPITSDDPVVICSGDSVVISVSDSFNTVEWNNGMTGNSIWITEPGDYYAIVWQGNDFFSLTDTVTLDMFEMSEFEVFSSDIDCYGDSTGTILIEGELESITWDGGESQFSLESLSGGIYTFVATDLNGCELEGEVELIQAPEITGVLSTTDVSCFGLNDGTVFLDSLQGGAGVLEIVSDFDPDSLLAGDYTISVLDSLGCVQQWFFNIDEPAELMGEVITTDSNDDDGSATLTLEGGVEPYTITWSNGVVEEVSIDGIEIGDYSVSIVDANGCSLAIDFSIDQWVGINSVNSKLSLFPNPTGDILHIHGLSSRNTIRVIGTDGSTNGALMWIDGRVDLSQYAPGLYTLIIEDLDSGRRFVTRIQKF